MEARCARILAALALASSLAAGYRTTNFIVTAPSPELARELAETAERLRDELAVEWLGRRLPRWSEPCPIVAHVCEGAGGATTFSFRHGQPFAWQMTIQGPPQRLLDSVLPHEITHTVFATHFGRPLPRWADEGACTTVEHETERSKQQRLLIRYLTSERGIPFAQMFAMMEYPADILPLYAQGYSVARFLIALEGRRSYVQFIQDGLTTGHWPVAVSKHYGFPSLGKLQVAWVDWVRHGSREDLAEQWSPRARAPETTRPLLADSSAGTSQPRSPTSWYARQSELAEPRPVSTAQDSMPTGRSTSRPQSLQGPQTKILR